MSEIPSMSPNRRRRRMTTSVRRPNGHGGCAESYSTASPPSSTSGTAGMSSLCLGLAVCLALPALVSGMTANPRPFVTTHGPKGDENEQTTATTITLRLNGDPTHQYLTDVDGFTCLINEEAEYYHYAVRASSLDNTNADHNGHPDELVPHPTAICGSLSNPLDELDGIDGRRMVPPKSIRLGKCGQYCADREERIERRERARQLLAGGAAEDTVGAGEERRMLRGGSDNDNEKGPSAYVPTTTTMITGDPLHIVPATSLEPRSIQGNQGEQPTASQLHASIQHQLQNQVRHLTGSSGTLRCLVVPFKFSDHTNRPLPTKSELQIMMGHDGLHPKYAPTGSVRYALDEFSYGNLDLDPVVWDWVTLSKTEAHYSGVQQGGGMGLGTYFHEALREALTIHNDARADFKQFDVKEKHGEGDGWIDAILFLHSGYGAEGGFTDCLGTPMQALIWSHEWSLQTPWTSHDNVNVGKYAVNSAVYGSGMEDLDGDGIDDCKGYPCCANPPPIARVGSLIHEIMHYLDLPDLYDSEGGFGAGSWAIMANAWGHDDSQKNCPQLSPWSKSAFGWMRQLLISQEGTYEIDASWDTNEVYRINLGQPQANANGRVDEYLLIENKWTASFESTIPQPGLVIWNVDAKQRQGNENEGFPGQPGYPANGNGYMVSVVQADGKYQLEKGINEGDAFDVFHGDLVDELGPPSDPNNPAGGPFPNTAYVTPSRVLKDTGVRIYDISKAGPKMTFKVQFNYRTPSRNNPYGERKLYGPFDGNNKNSGVMFDMMPQTDMRITGFDVRMFSTKTHRFEVYYKYGTHIGHTNKKESWTQLDDGNLNVQALGPSKKTPLTGFQAVPVSKNQKVAFFIAHTEPVMSRDDLYLAYSNGQITDDNKDTWMNQIWFQNEDLVVFQGTGQGYHHEFINPNTFPARNPNVVVRYEYGLTQAEPRPVTQLTTDYCKSSPCQNGSTCTNKPSVQRGYECQCSSGWGGPTCETDTADGCVGNPCKNGGQCTDTSSGLGFSCSCPQGWDGDTCEEDVEDGCASSPCANGGTCTDTSSGAGFTCACAADWGGPTCETDTADGCVGSPCKNGGQCTDTSSGLGFSCACPQGWDGDTCEEDILDGCESNPCVQGTCEDTSDNVGYRCICSGGYTGDNCDVAPPTEPPPPPRSDPTPGPSPTLMFQTSLLEGNNQAKGNMFDISAEGSDLWLRSFSIHVDEPGTQVPVKVYVKEASYVGSENSLNDWTLICSTTLTSAGPQAPTNIPLGVCTEHQIPQNERHGVYIAVDADADAHMIYTSVDPSPNGVHATTDRFVIHEGIGKGAEMANSYGPSRRWNGELYYG